MVLAKREIAFGRRAKLVHVIRHGEAQHNVNSAWLKKRHPRLTARGQRQARALRSLAPKLMPEVVLTSPGLRALQTTAAMRAEAPVVVVPDARERVSCREHLCDLPADSSVAASSAHFQRFDWSKANKVMMRAGGPMKYEEVITQTDDKEANIRRRARNLTKYLLARPEKCMTLVSHGAFLMRLTGDEYFGNCEVRTYAVKRGQWKLKKVYLDGYKAA